MHHISNRYHGKYRDQMTLRVMYGVSIKVTDTHLEQSTRQNVFPSNMTTWGIQQPKLNI